LGARSWLTGSELEAGWSKDGKTVTWRKSSAAAKGQAASFDLSEFVLGPNRLSKTYGAITEQGAFSLKSPDGKYVQLLKNKKPFFDLKLPDNRNKGGYMTLQGKNFAVIAGKGQSLYVFDTNTGKLLRPLGHGGEIRGAAPSPDGRYLLTIS